MLLLVDPRQHAVADIVRLFRGETVETYDGTAGDIFARVIDNDEPVPYAVTARPLTAPAASHTTTVICHRCGLHGPSGPDADAARIYDAPETAGWTSRPVPGVRRAGNPMTHRPGRHGPARVAEPDPCSSPPRKAPDDQ